jgi:hypothetical protein
MKKKWKKTKSQSAKSKKHESKITGGKRENQKGKIGKQWTCPFAFFFAFILPSRFVVLFAFILFYAWKKNMQKKSKKTNRKSKILQKTMQMDNPLFPQFFPF